MREVPGRLRDRVPYGAAAAAGGSLVSFASLESLESLEVDEVDVVAAMGCDCEDGSDPGGVLVDVCGGGGRASDATACVEFLLDDALLGALDGGAETSPDGCLEDRALTCLLPVP
jgi:hypothetical protein